MNLVIIWWLFWGHKSRLQWESSRSFKSKFDLEKIQTWLVDRIKIWIHSFLSVSSSHVLQGAAPCCPSWAQCCPSWAPCCPSIEKAPCPFQLLSRPTQTHPGHCDWLNTFITIILGIHTYDVTNTWWSGGVFTVVVTGDVYTSNLLPSRWLV